MTDRTTINVTKDAHEQAQTAKTQENHTWSEVLEWYANHVGQDDIGASEAPIQDIDTSELAREFWRQADYGQLATKVADEVEGRMR